MFCALNAREGAMKRKLRAAAVLLFTASLAGCGGPVRVYSKPPKEISQAPQRMVVIYSVFSGANFSKRLAENLRACGVDSKYLDAYAKPKGALKVQVIKLADDFSADFALEVTATMSESDQYGPRGNWYEVVLTDLARKQQVWEASMSLFIRRIQRSGTEMDLADELVWKMADAKILPSCPPRPKEKGQE